jgi:hypothetical protein
VRLKMTPEGEGAAPAFVGLALEQVAALRHAFWGRGYRPLAIWSPGAENDRGEPIKGAGKRPVGINWREKALQNPPAVLSEPISRLQLNTGIVCGDVVAADIDVLNQYLVDQLVHLVEQKLGPTPLTRIGRAPKTLLLYRAETPIKKMRTPELFLPDGSKAQIEILAAGQQFVAAGIHPDTRQPYQWSNGSPAEVSVDELPVVTAAMLRELIVEAEAILRAAGAVEKKVEDKPLPQRKRRPKDANGSTFFRNVNKAALGDISAWAEELLPRGRYSPNGAYRVSSAVLGRAGVEEDLSIHPHGIWDFGLGKPLTPIDLVITWTDESDPVEAAHWLCRQLGVSPPSLGWSNGHHPPPQPAPSPGPAPPQPAPPPADHWEVDKKKNQPVANSQKNVRLALDKLHVKLRHDVFATRSLISSPTLPERALDDPTLERLWLEIDETFRFRPTIEFFTIVLRDIAHRNEFHPVLDYLDSLRWDGQNRLDDWLFTYGTVPTRDADYNQYVRTVGRIVLIAAVRRLRQPGCKFDEMMIFVSEAQGTDKSTALSILAIRSEWFTDSIDLGAKDKEAIEQQQGKWIAEIPEMRGRRKNDVDRIKAFLSRTTDRARLAYGRLQTELPRQCVYFGSANDVKFLRDRSGNRRFWPILDVNFDVRALAADVDQLWAEAVAAESNGESIRLPPILWPVAQTVQTESLEEDPWADILSTALEELDGKIRAADVWIILDIDVARRTPDADGRMGYAMREIGWARKQRRYGGNPEWGYVKGSGHQISASRDSYTGTLRITQGHGRDARTWTIDRGKTIRVEV